MTSNNLVRWTGRQPLSALPAFATRDPEIAIEFAGKLLSPHRMRLPAGAAGFAARVNARRWQDVTLSYFSYGADVQVSAGDEHVFYGVNLPLTGYAEVTTGGAAVYASPWTSFVLSGWPSTEMRWSPGYSVLCVKLEPAALERHLARMAGARIDRRIEFEPAMPFHGGGLTWTGVVQMLIDLAERPSEPSPLLVAEVESSVMTALLTVQPHNYCAALFGHRSVPGRVVGAAIELMRSREGAVLTVAEIADRVGISERSLQLSFRRQLGMRPSEYLRDARLEQVRHELLATSPEDRSVSRVAMDWGFSNLGRFAGAYRRKFGEKPSQTARSRSG